MTDTPLRPSLEEFKNAASRGNMIPVFTELTADFETPLSAFHKINDGEHCFLFESAESSDAAGRFSFLGSAPRMIIQGRGQTVSITENGSTREYEAARDPLQELEDIMGAFKPVPMPELPVFYGGVVGYLAYDAVRYFEPTVPAPPPDEVGAPEMIFMVTNTVLIFDHRYRKILVVANVFTDDYDDLDQAYEDARSKIDGIIHQLDQPLKFSQLKTYQENKELVPRSNTTQEEYCDMVRKAKDYILAGDIFQVVPSQRLEVDYTGSPIDLYRALRHVNPSPYMFCLQFPDGFSLVGSSPEVHVRCIDSKIEIRPIAGTRWRGKTREEDEALAAELLADPKERAEHIMLVDLARNDVGRVSQFSSVEVTDFMIIERYSHVMHIVSNVVGRLDGEHSAYDVMRATFPAGTVSGSPKVRAMQVINEMEKSKRCAYAGAVGYFGFDGNHDSCIALRTAVLRNGKVYIQAGAGVVADSDPEYEYRETLNKATAMIRAVERARGI